MNHFGIRTLFYVTALFAAAVGAFGWMGVIPAGVVSGFWWIMFGAKNRPVTLFRAALVFVGLLLGIACLLPTVNTARPAARSIHCRSNLRQIQLAIMSYATQNDCYPADVQDEQGRPLLSWRVLILPYLESSRLYDQIHLDEPWNSTNNRRLASRMPPTFRCPSSTAAANQTHYLAVTGPETAWPKDKPMTPEDISRGDGGANTLMIFESPEKSVHWMKPEDVEMDEALKVLAKTHYRPSSHGHANENMFTIDPLAVSLVMADGSVHQMKCGRLSAEEIKPMCTIDAGDEMAADVLENSFQPRIRWATMISLAAFVLLTLLPIPWVWKRTTESASVNPNED